MKKLISVLLMLCLLLSMTATAFAAYDGSKPACQKEGHAKWDGTDHSRPQSCWVKGHFNCDGMDHARAACGAWGHFNCDGKDHSPSVCGAEGHYVCGGGEHAVAACGKHCVYDGKNHEQAACGLEGHFACEGKAHNGKVVSQYCNAVPQHMACEGNPMHTCDPAQGGCGVEYRCSDSNKHTACRMCGLLWCDSSLGGHYTPCGNAEHRPCVYTMKGKTYLLSEHPQCEYCGGGKCDGEAHGNGKCCESCPKCGRAEKMGYKHMAPCEMHYWCMGGKHEYCDKCYLFSCHPAYAERHAKHK